MGYHPLHLRALAFICYLLAHADLTLAVDLYNNSVPAEYKDTVKDMVLSLELIDTELIERVHKDDFK